MADSSTSPELRTPSRMGDWLLVSVWIAGIYLLIPIARVLRETVANSVGRSFFGYTVIILVAAGTIYGIRLLLRRHSGNPPLGRLAVLFAIAVFYIYFTILLWENPEESMHFIQYGVLGLLFLRLLGRHYTKGQAVYFCAVAACACVGTVDEIVQWAVPERYFDFRDIRINTAGSVLAVLAVRFGFNPVSLQGAWDRSGLKIFCRSLAVQVVLLGVCFFNTPSAVEKYASRWKALDFLKENPSSMHEFGYLHRAAPELEFKSRLSLETLLAEDASRGKEAGRILDQYHSPSTYGSFLRVYRPGSDPFLHEARVHLFRRNRFIDRLGDRDVKADPAYTAGIAWTALSEHRIMTFAFSNTLAHADRYELRPSQVAFLEEKALEKYYLSPVSRGLTTRISPMAQALLLFGLLAGILVGEKMLRNRLPCRNSPGSA